MALATLLVGNNTYQIGADGIVSPDPTEQDLLAFSRMQDLTNLDAPEEKTPKQQAHQKQTQPKPKARQKMAKKKR